MFIFYFKNINLFFLITVTFFLFLFNFNYILIDLNIFLQNDDSVFSFLMFWWNTTHFLNFFYFFYFFYFFFNFFSFKNIFFIFFLIFYNLEILNVVFSNFSLSAISFLNVASNHLLLNYLNKYHPFCLYLSFFFFIWANSKILLFFSNKSNLLFDINFLFLKLFFNNNTYVFLISFFALFLGSWWAEQEGSWGGWWNWDPSENLGLVPALCSLFFFHFLFKFYFWNKFNFILFNLEFFFIFLFFYFFLQLNFDLVSHNFGLKFFFFFNHNNFLLVLNVNIFILFFFYYYYYCQSFFFLTLAKNFTELRYNLFFFLIYVIYFFFFLLISFHPLIDFFLWNFYSIASFNQIYHFKFFKYYWFYFFIILFFKKTTTVLPIFITFDILHTPINFLTIKINKFSILHFHIIIALILIFFSNTFFILFYESWNVLTFNFIDEKNFKNLANILAWSFFSNDVYNYFELQLWKYQTHFLVNTLSSLNSFFLELFYNLNYFIKIYYFNKNYVIGFFFFFFIKNIYFSKLLYVVWLNMILIFYYIFYKKKNTLTNFI